MSLSPLHVLPQQEHSSVQYYPLCLKKKKTWGKQLWLLLHSCHIKLLQWLAVFMKQKNPKTHNQQVNSEAFRQALPHQLAPDPTLAQQSLHPGSVPATAEPSLPRRCFLLALNVQLLPFHTAALPATSRSLWPGQAAHWCSGCLGKESNSCLTGLPSRRLESILIISSHLIARYCRNQNKDKYASCSFVLPVFFFVFF